MIVAFITDLFAQAQIGRTAIEAGIELRLVTSIYKFLPELDNSPAAVLVDLGAAGISPTSLIAQVKQRNPAPPVIAFVADSDPVLAEAARVAGADQVVSGKELDAALGEFSESGSASA